MKTQKQLIKGILTVAMLASSVQSFAASVVIEKDTKLVSDLISKLGTPVVVSKSLVNQEELKKISNKPRISFSTSLRRYLQENSIALANDEKYNVPTTFSPSWSPEKAKAIKMERKNYICRQMMEKMNIDTLLHDLKIEASKFKMSSAPADAAAANSAVFSVNQALVSELNQAIGGLSKDDKGLEVSQKLGNVISADVVNDSVAELHLSLDSKNISDLNSISLSLPMLIGFENVRDYYFVDSVACLSRLLVLERSVLNYRKAELQDPKIAQQTIEYFRNLVDAYFAYQSQARRENKMPATMDAFIKSQLNERAERDTTAMYLSKKDSFLAKINAGPGEIEILNSRLADLSIIIPYIQFKQLGSEFAHKQLKKLSEKQVRELVTLMLELQKNNIPNDKSLKKIEELGHQDEQFAAEAVYYKNLNESLDELMMGLTKPR